MDLKVLFSVFAIVFVMELGDKTQLTALAATTSTKTPWMVFIGASLGLIASTAVAVLLGEALTRFIPKTVIEIGAAVLFILIGTILLTNIARKAPAEEESETSQPEVEAALIEKKPALSRFIIKQACIFEEKVAENLMELADQTKSPEDAAIIRRIAEEDLEHLHNLDNQISPMHDSNTDTTETAGQSVSIPPPEAHPLQEENEHENLQKAIETEEAAGNFYLTLARRSTIPAARETFHWLAMEEIRHARELQQLLSRNHG
jgi:rubrerythrin